MSVASRITSMTEHIQNAYDSIERFGVDTESIDKNLVNLSNTITNEIYDKLPKVSGNGSNFTLESVQKGKLDLFEMEGNTIQGRLPSEYTQVDYIESSGTQYIDTGVNADTNLRVVLDIAYTSPTSANQNIGAIRLESGNTARYHLLSQSGYFRIYVNNAGYNTINSDTNRHVFDIKQSIGIATIDNQDFTISSEIMDVNLSFYLFGRNSTSIKFYSQIKQWACKMYYNNVLVRDFIPCYRNSDNEVGLYDLVNNVFYTNQGTGSFTYGAIAPTPDSPIDIEVVENKQLVNVRSNQLLDYADTYNITNETYVFENDILTLNQTPNTTYAFLTYRITELIKNNPGKEVKFSYENIDLSNFNSPNNTIVQLRINRGSANEDIALLTKNLTTATYTIPNDTSDIEFVNFNIYTNNSNTSLASSSLTITEPLLYFDNNNEYSKYHNQDYEIDLGDIELCKIGDYKDVIFKNNQLSSYYDSTLDEDSWYIKKNIGKVVLDGSETYVRVSSDGSTYNKFAVTSFQQIIDKNGDLNLLCNKLMSSNSNINTCSIATSGSIVLSFQYDFVEYNATTLTNLINQLYINNNPFVLYIPLATPTYEKITNSTLISQLEAIETETGTNIFEVSNENNVLPSLNVKRLKELEKLS